MAVQGDNVDEYVELLDRILESDDPALIAWSAEEDARCKRIEDLLQ